MSVPPKVEQRIVIKPAMPASIPEIDIDYVTMTIDTAEEDFLKNDVYMCVSWQDYLTMAQWEQEKLRYIKQLREVVRYYEKQIEELSKGQ